MAIISAHAQFSEVESYMNQKGVEYRTIDKTRAGRIYERLKAHITPPKRMIQILGTNGKGSTGRFLTLMLMQNGAKVLHFTSPHIFSFNERFYKNGAIIGNDELLEAHRFLQKFDFISECSYFEYATFLACVLAQGVDYLILEAGVGGELDSTSVIAREMCIFSVIDYDHTEILGESIEEIATTKLNAVFYPNRVKKMVLGAQKYEIVERIAREIAKVHNVTLYSVESHKNSSLGASFALGGNFGEQQTHKSSFIPKNSHKYKSHTANTRIWDLDSSESSDSQDSPSLAVSTPPQTPPARGGAFSLSLSLVCGESKNSPSLAEGASGWVKSISSLRGRIIDSHEAIQNFCDSKNDKFNCASAQPLKSVVGGGGGSCEGGGGERLCNSQESLHLSPHPLPQEKRALNNMGFNEDLSATKRKAIDSNMDCHESPNADSRNDAIQSYLTKHHLAPFLVQNLTLALKALEILGLQCELKTLPKLDLRGRFEQIAPNIIIDVGHNQNAAFAIKQNLGQKKVILVYNSYFQKNISEILGILKDDILRVEILAVADNPRIIEQKTLEHILKSLGIPYSDFKGVDYLESSENYLVFGSFSVVESFMREFESKSTELQSTKVKI